MAEKIAAPLELITSLLELQAEMSEKIAAPLELFTPLFEFRAEMV